MTSLLIAFFTSFIVTALIIRTQSLHVRLSGDNNFDGPQKFHTNNVPRIGGIAIGTGIFVAVALRYQNNLESTQDLALIFCALPVISIGLAEDLTKKMSVKIRLIFIAFGALLASLLLGAQINSLDIPVLDYLLIFPVVSIILTIFAVTGLTNAYNIIDGFNGLSSMVGMITLLGLGYVSFKINDPMIFSLSFTMVAAILGFFIWNYPRGLIFLGDGGAYFIGFWVAVESVLIVCRHREISPWFAILLNAYPILETLFTLYRRKLHQGKNPGLPDGIHFHSLIFRRILNRTKMINPSDWLSANAKTSPYLWILSGAAIIPAILFYNSPLKLICFLLLFTTSYLWIYIRVVKFKTPKWLFL